MLMMMIIINKSNNNHIENGQRVFYSKAICILKRQENKTSSRNAQSMNCTSGTNYGFWIEESFKRPLLCSLNVALPHSCVSVLNYFALLFNWIFFFTLYALYFMQR